MLVTIYTDASVKEPLIGYSYRAKSILGRIEGGGAEEVKMTSNQAEHHAIKAAIRHVIKVWPTVKVLFINTDSLNCCKTYWQLGGIKKNGAIRELLENAKIVSDWCDKNDIQIRMKWVKAHVQNSNVRFYLNNWCDGKASLYRRIKEKSINKRNEKSIISRSINTPS